MSNFVESNYSELQSKYSGKFIAIFKDRVIEQNYPQANRNDLKKVLYKLNI